MQCEEYYWKEKTARWEQCHHAAKFYFKGITGRMHVCGKHNQERRKGFKRLAFPLDEVSHGSD